MKNEGNLPGNPQALSRAQNKKLSKLSETLMKIDSVENQVVEMRIFLEDHPRNELAEEAVKVGSIRLARLYRKKGKIEAYLKSSEVSYFEVVLR